MLALHDDDARRALPAVGSQRDLPRDPEYIQRRAISIREEPLVVLLDLKLAAQILCGVLIDDVHALTGVDEHAENV